MKSFIFSLGLFFTALNAGAENFPDFVTKVLPSLVSKAEGVVNVIEANNNVVIPQIALFFAPITQFGR